MSKTTNLSEIIDNENKLKLGGLAIPPRSHLQEIMRNIELVLHDKLANDMGRDIPMGVGAYDYLLKHNLQLSVYLPYVSIGEVLGLEGLNYDADTINPDTSICAYVLTPTVTTSGVGMVWYKSSPAWESEDDLRPFDGVYGEDVCRNINIVSISDYEMLLDVLVCGNIGYIYAAKLVQT